MFEDNDGYTRRQLLQATAGAGVLGAGAGAATGAYFSDMEVFSANPVQAGSFSLELAAVTDDSEEFEFQDISTVTVDLPTLEPGDSGTVRTGYRLCDTPGWIWARPTMDGGSEGELEKYLDVRFLERPDCGDTAKKRFEGDLSNLIDRYEEGLKLGESCVGCDPGCLEIEWEYDSDPPVHVSNESVSLSLEFAAVQCRHYDSRPESPWN